MEGVARVEQCFKAARSLDRMLRSLELNRELAKSTMPEIKTDTTAGIEAPQQQFRAKSRLLGNWGFGTNMTHQQTKEVGIGVVFCVPAIEEIDKSAPDPCRWLGSYLLFLTMEIIWPNCSPVGCHVFSCLMYFALLAAKELGLPSLA